MPSIIVSELYGYIRSYIRNFEFIIDIVSWPLWILGIVLGVAIYNPSIIRDPNTMSWLAWGVLVLAIISDKLWIIGHSVERELRSGVLENIATSPEPIWLHYLCISIYSIVSTFPAVALTILIIFPILNVIYIPSNIPLFIIGYILAELASSGLALIYSSIAVMVKRPWIATNIIQFIIPVLSGMIPYHIAPDQLKAIIMLNPLSYPFEAMKRGALGSISIPIGMTEVIVISIATIITFYILGIAAVGNVVNKLRRKGSLQHQ